MEMRQKEANRLKNDDRKCRICRWAEESLLHTLKECDVTKNEMLIEEFIGKEEKELELMKKIKKKLKEEVTDVTEEADRKCCKSLIKKKKELKKKRKKRVSDLDSKFALFK